MAGSSSRQDISGNLNAAEKKAIRDAGMTEMESLIDMAIKKKIEHRESNWISHPNLTPPNTDTRLNLLLVGVGGAGKSALASLLYGDSSPGSRPFVSSNRACAETLQAHQAESEIDGQKINIIDTPGYYVENLLSETFKGKNVTNSKRILEEIGAIGGDLNAIIVVINLGNARTRELELKILESVKMVTEKSVNYTMIVATHAGSSYSNAGADKFQQDNQPSKPMAQFLKDINGRFVLVELPGENRDLSQVGLTVPSEKEKEQARRMVMSMVGKVLSDSEPFGHYSMSQFVADMKECFPAKSLVYTTHGERCMEDLQVGDKVLVIDQEGFHKYEEVIMFSHAIPDHVSTFVTITTEGGNVLRLSPGHFIHVCELGQLTAAQDVHVGDVVFTLDWRDELKVKPTRVTAIAHEQLRGVYCPHTPSGSIMVDGVLASCYTDIMPPAAAHTAMYLVRLLYRVLPSDWFTWMLPYNAEQGMPSVVWNLKNALL